MESLELTSKQEFYLKDAAYKGHSRITEQTIIFISQQDELFLEV